MSDFINTQIYAPINDYIKLFLQASSERDQERWGSVENQESFTKLITNLVNNKKMTKKMKKAYKKTMDKENEVASRPKKVKSDYICFCITKRPEIKEKHPELSNKEITTELGRLWQLVKNNPDELQLFKEMVNLDKERFQQEMSQQQPTDKKTKKVKSADGVQKNLSAYIIFCKDVREPVKADHPELNNKQIMSEMANRWKNVDADVKKKYEQLASEDKERYLRQKSALADGAQESKEVEPEAPVPDTKKKSGGRKKKVEEPATEPVLVPEVPEPVVVDEGKKKKAGGKKKKVEEESVPAPVVEAPPAEPVQPVAKKNNNGYINYTKVMRASVSAETGLDFKATTIELSKRWKALSEEDKQKYKEGTPVDA
jgi:hypothetical protein